MEFLDLALSYMRRSWSVVPLEAKGKRPRIAWRHYQQNIANEQIIRYWWEKNASSNVGIVTGSVSGLIVVDVDGDDGKASIRDKVMPVTPIVSTGRGFHYYFSHPGGEIANGAALLPGVDIRGDGGYVVAPPSIHPSGRRYEWLLSPENTYISPPPDWIMDLIRPDPATPLIPPPKPKRNRWDLVFSTAVQEGSRNTTIAKVAGYLLRMRGMDPEVALYLTQAWNRCYCIPPLDDDEVITVVNSIAGREVEKRRRRALHG